MFDATDNLRLCKNCADYETTSPDGICSHCKEQSMIDDIVPTPFDWSVWDERFIEDEDDWNHWADEQLYADEPSSYWVNTWDNLPDEDEYDD